MEHVYDVSSVTVSIAKGMPPRIIVVAGGRVSSSGWTNPTLGTRYYINAPTDGIQDFDFYADAPTERPLTMPMPIVAEAAITRDPNDYWGPGKPLLGVRIHTRTNSLEEKLNIRSDGPGMMAEGLPLPWPFPWRKPNLMGGEMAFPFKLQATDADVITSETMIGRMLRVYKTGDGLTKDFRPDRVNIELNPSSEQIVYVWIG